MTTLTEKAVDLMKGKTVVKRGKTDTCDTNHRIRDDWNSPRNRFYAAYRQVRFARRFGM